MQIVEIPIGDIRSYSQNAKDHPDEQVRRIAASIREFGFNQPIVVDQDGVIVVGHGRYLAAHLIGLEKVLVLRIDISEEKARAYRLADNKLNESEWRMGVVIEELKLLSPEMIDLTGFDRSDLDGKILASEISQIAVDRDIDLGKYKVLTVEAPEAPRIKARASFYFSSIEEFDAVKRFFNEKGGELDSSKLLGFLKK
jgi:ParB-like chromosome segregation protein Spo0J